MLPDLASECLRQLVSSYGYDGRSCSGWAAHEDLELALLRQVESSTGEERELWRLRAQVWLRRYRADRRRQREACEALALPWPPMPWRLRVVARDAVALWLDDTEELIHACGPDAWRTDDEVVIASDEWQRRLAARRADVDPIELLEERRMRLLRIRHRIGGPGGRPFAWPKEARRGLDRPVVVPSDWSPDEGDPAGLVGRWSPGSVLVVSAADAEACGPVEEPTPKRARAPVERVERVPAEDVEVVEAARPVDELRPRRRVLEARQPGYDEFAPGDLDGSRRFGMWR